MEYLSYIRPELGVLVAVLYALGLLLKQSAVVKDKHIPGTLGVVGLVLGTVYVLGTSAPATAAAWFSASFSGVSQGILCAAAAVYAHQLYKQSGKDE